MLSDYWKKPSPEEGYSAMHVSVDVGFNLGQELNGSVHLFSFIKLLGHTSGSCRCIKRHNWNSAGWILS